jgi:hypothetical protein
MTKPEGRRLGGHGRPADVVGWRVRQDLVDHADPVEADHDRQAAGDRRRLVPADVLQPAHVALDIHAYRREWIQALVGAPAQEHPKIRFGVQTGLAAIATQIGGHRRPQHNMIRRRAGIGNR